MKQSLFRFVLLFSSIFFLNACFHKDVDSAEVDDIKKAMLHSFNGKDYLVNYELIFQATSKSSENGITQISGYNDTRISVYNLNSGELVVREQFGEYSEDEAEEVLAVIDDKIWLYSVENELYAVDLLTLEKTVSKDDIIEKNAGIDINFSKPEWFKISQFYGFNPINQQIIFSDNQGFKYELNPKTLKVKKVNNIIKIPSSSFKQKYFSNSLNFQGQRFGFQGDLRKTITADSKFINENLTYLEAKFITDKNPARISKKLETQTLDYKQKLKELQSKLNSITGVKNGLQMVFSKKQRDERRNLEHEIRDLKRELKKLEIQSEIMQKSGFFSSKETFLQAKNKNAFFVVYRENTDKTAKLRISMIELDDNFKGKERWNIVLGKVFFDINSARETSSFKTVFSKGDPRFDFQFFDILGDKLVVIYMLHTYCIDIKSGKILWSFRV